MKKAIISIIIIGSVLFLNENLAAQKPNPFTEKTTDISKISIKIDFPAEGRTSKNGGGFSANLDLVNPKPKRVALISYYLFDPGCGETKGGALAGAASSAVWRTSDNLAQIHIDGFYINSIGGLKAGFQEYGIELLTPDQYLDTDEKKDFFYGFDQETGKKEKTEAAFIGRLGTMVSISNIKICPTDKGYRPFFISNEPLNSSTSTNFVNMGIGASNRKMTSSLGYELCKGLGVDAVVVCYIVTRKPDKKKENYVVDAVTLMMIGPNPVSIDPEDKNRGQFYCGTRYFADQLVFSDGKTSFTSYENMNNLMLALSKKMGNWVINKEK